MKKFDLEQDFYFDVKVQVSLKGKDYDEVFKRAIDEINKIAGGEVKIEEIKCRMGSIKI